MMYCCSCVPFMQSYVELLGFLCLIIGGIWSYIVWRSDVKKKHAEIFSEMIATFISPELFGIFDELIERERLGQIRFDGEKGTSGTRSEDREDQLSQLDRMLMFFNEICYLKGNGQIGPVEFGAFAYPINKTLVNDIVCQYLLSLREKCTEMFPYDALMDYFEKFQELNRKDPNIMVLDDDFFTEYLIARFGAMTHSAQSVKARVHTLMRVFNCTMDELVSSENVARKRIAELSAKFPLKSNERISDLKNAVKHCFNARTGTWIQD